MASRSVLTSRSQHFHPTQPSRTCLCSPSTHPGSFRCSKHKKPPRAMARSRSLPRILHRWDPSMAAKANSLKEILLQMLKPSNHDLHMRKSFQPKPTRFSLMNGDAGAVAVS